MTFEEYFATLAPLKRAAPTPEELARHADIRSAAEELVALPRIDRSTLEEYIVEHPDRVPLLGLVIGLSSERLKNELRHRFDTSGWVTLARKRAGEVIAELDDDFGLVAQLEAQRAQSYTFGDVLVARAGTRQSAGAAIAGGRSVEDAIEAVARELGLPCAVRTQFIGRDRRTAPCDLAIPVGGEGALIVCAAKAFDSTGSKLSDAVREIEAMADVRLPAQFVFAVVDGIGWKNRQADLRRIHDLWVAKRIDGLYTVATLDRFAVDLDNAAKRLDLPRTSG